MKQYTVPSYVPNYGYPVMNNNYDCLLKLLLIGNSHVGKSAMLLRFTEGVFTHNFYNTIGVDFVFKQNPKSNRRRECYNVTEKRLSYKSYNHHQYNQWDTAGQDRFKTITNNYYRGAHGVLIVFDVTDRVSFENVKQWMQDIEKYADENIVKILVGNKIDKKEFRKISMREGMALAQKYGLKYAETSAKTAFNIDEIFTLIAQDIYTLRGSSLIRPPSSKGSSDCPQSDRKKTQQSNQLNGYQHQRQQSGCC